MLPGASPGAGAGCSACAIASALLRPPACSARATNSDQAAARTDPLPPKAAVPLPFVSSVAIAVPPESHCFTHDARCESASPHCSRRVCLWRSHLLPLKLIIERRGNVAMLADQRLTLEGLWLRNTIR